MINDELNSYKSILLQRGEFRDRFRLMDIFLIPDATTCYFIYICEHQYNDYEIMILNYNENKNQLREIENMELVIEKYIKITRGV